MVDRTSPILISFACPFCHGAWKFEEFAVIAKSVFDSFDGEGTCPICKGTFSWVRPGEMTGELGGKPWWKQLEAKGFHYLPKKCGNERCERMIEGRRKYCSVNCRQAAYYQRTKRFLRPRK